MKHSHSKNFANYKIFYEMLFFSSQIQSDFNCPKFFIGTKSLIILPLLLMKQSKTCCIELCFVKVKDFC